ncbi:MAG TPA: type IV pilus biogenesis protein EbsA [Allocoleopsis sp.]
MTTNIDQLKPAEQSAINMYMPYYQGTKRTVLPFALSLYQKGNLEGSRHIEGGESIPFAANWNVSKLPAELTRCQLSFLNDADLSYGVMMANSELVNYLIDLIIGYKRDKITDFPQTFYKRLLKMDD